MIVDEYKYTSLCEVNEIYEGHIRLHRLGDIAENIIKEGFLNGFPDRAYLYSKEGIFIKDYIGVWNWYLRPNKRDSSKNYVDSAFDRECVPIEIVILPDCKTIQDVVQSLKHGINRPILSDKTMYACRDAKLNKYVGVLCTIKELVETTDVTKFKEEVICLQQYYFQRIDMCKFDNRIVFKSFDVDPSDKVVYIKDALEMVKEKVLARTSWSVTKQKGLTKREYKMVHDFISTLPLESLIEEVASSLNCSIENAKDLVSSFMKQANTYITGKNIENEIIYQVIQYDSDLTAQCKESLLEDWKKENKNLLDEAESNLNNLKGKIDSEEKKLKTLSQKCIAQKEQLDSLNKKITEQEKLASDVENAVKSRIEKAKENAAAFIATQAFAQPTIVSQAEPPGKEPIILKRGYELPAYNIDTYNDWLYLLEFLQSKLEDEGVSAKWSKDVAAFLYAAFLNHCPILLIGPNGRAIADTFSACVSGRTCAYLDCETKYNPKILDELEKTDEAVVVIDNLFNPEWNRHINSYAENSPKFVIAITPYAEDLLIEPKGVLNYWIPLMTELFVERKPDYDFKGGKQGKDFRYFVSTKSIRKSGRSLRKLKLSPLTRTTLQKLLTDMFLMVESGLYNLDAELLVAGIPCAYILGELDCLKEYKDESVVDESMLDILKRYLGEAE